MKTYVAVGEQLELVMPYSEVCMHLQVAGTKRTVRVLEGAVQILNADGSKFSLPVTSGEAGLHSDAGGYYTHI